LRHCSRSQRSIHHKTAAWYLEGDRERTSVSYVSFMKNFNQLKNTALHFASKCKFRSWWMRSRGILSHPRERPRKVKK
jgi:hypothetical protein